MIARSDDHDQRYTQLYTPPQIFGGGIECYSYPRIEGQNPIEPLKIYELDFILTGLLVMITLQPPPKKILTNSISEDGTGIFSRYNDHGQHGLDKYLLLAKENSFCCPKTCCQVAIILSEGIEGIQLVGEADTFRESNCWDVVDI